MVLLYLPFTVPRAAARLFFLFALGFVAACDKVPLVAPTESTIALTVSSTTLGVNGTLQVSATVTESAGTPVHNGTIVTFTGSLGTFEPADVPTHNGRAVTTFRSNGQSGTASIGAVSGSAVADAVEVRIGGAAAETVLVRAEPSSVPTTTGGTVQIVASVLDVSGNALAGTPVAFRTDVGTLSSSSAVTDANGEARVSLTTNRDATVTATVGAKSGTVTVRAVPPAAVTIEFAPTAPETNVPVTFTVTPTNASAPNPIRSVVLDFGDGSQQSLGAITGRTQVSHTYGRAGAYSVTAFVTDSQGLTSETRIVVTVNERSPLPVSLTASPNPVSLATSSGLVTLTATVTGAVGGLTYFWNFGDGSSSEPLNNAVTTHRYRAIDTYVVTVTARSSTGQSGTAQITVRVNE
jgi:PKD repeat protein